MSLGLPEQQARVELDKALDAAGWLIQDRDELNLTAGRGVAVREFKMADGHGSWSGAARTVSSWSNMTCASRR